MIINKRHFIDYSLLFMVIAVSGIPYFTSTILYIPLSVILIIYFFIRKKKLDKKFVLFLILLTIITTLQAYIFDFFSFQTTLGIYLRVIIGYLIIKILKEKFIAYYINILYYLSITGTAIYLSIVILPSLESIYKSSLVPFLSIFNFSGTNLDTIIIYNFAHIEELRNSGPFWEPGAFAGYLIIAIIFLYFNNQILNKNKKLLILLFTLVTTLSTTSFIALSIFMLFYFYKNIKNIFIKITIIFSIIFTSYYAFFNFDFLGKKIEHQLNMAKNAKAYGADSDTQRFLNIMRDWEDFQGHELIGRGSNPLTRYQYKPEEQIRTVGLTDILVRVGIPFFIYILYLLYKSICSIVNHYKIYCIGVFLTIITILMSEVYFNFPLFWGLLFIFLVYKPKRKKNDIYNNPSIQ